MMPYPMGRIGALIPQILSKAEKTWQVRTYFVPPP